MHAHTQARTRTHTHTHTRTHTHAHAHTHAHTHTHIHTHTHTHTHAHTHTQKECNEDNRRGRKKKYKQMKEDRNLKSLVAIFVGEVGLQHSSEGMGKPNVTDVGRERIPLLWSTVRERALAKGFSVSVCLDNNIPYTKTQTGRETAEMKMTNKTNE